MCEYLIYDNNSNKLNKIIKAESEDFLNFAYKNINCNLIEYVSLINDIDVIVDEEGLLKNPIDVNIIYDKKADRYITLTGKMIFSGFRKGATIGLTQEQINYIKENIIIETLPIQIYRALK